MYNSDKFPSDANPLVHTLRSSVTDLKISTDVDKLMFDQEEAEKSQKLQGIGNILGVGVGVDRDHSLGTLLGKPLS